MFVAVMHMTRMPKLEWLIEVLFHQMLHKIDALLTVNICSAHSLHTIPQPIWISIFLSCPKLAPNHVRLHGSSLMRSHNTYPQKSTSYWLFLSNGTWSVTILMTSAPTQCLPYISLKTPLYIHHPLQLWDEVLVWGLYYSEPYYYSELSEHQVFHCTVCIISSDFYLY